MHILQRIVNVPRPEIGEFNFVRKESECVVGCFSARFPILMWSLLLPADGPLEFSCRHRKDLYIFSLIILLLDSGFHQHVLRKNHLFFLSLYV